MDRAWAYATAIVNINTGKSYTVKQVKKMDTKFLLTLVSTSQGGQRAGDGIKGGQAELSRRTGIPQVSEIRLFLLILLLKEA